MLNQNKSDKQFLKPEPDEMSANDFVHEFNNLLTAIISNLSIARMDSSPESDLDNTLLEAESAAHEAIELTKQFFLSNNTAVAGKPRKEVQFDEQNSFSGDRKVLVIDDRGSSQVWRALQTFDEIAIKIVFHLETNLYFTLFLGLCFACPCYFP